LAEERGLQVKEEKDPVPHQFANEITVRLATTGEEVIVGGTHLRGRTHVTRVGEHMVDAAVESPYLLIIENIDRPGTIGTVGELAGRNDINISFMEVGRAEARGNATMMVGLDDPMPDSILEELRQNPNITSVRLIQM
jgi:D-3-phosphoglycerate dehydrogenase